MRANWNGAKADLTSISSFLGTEDRHCLRKLDDSVSLGDFFSKTKRAAEGKVRGVFKKSIFAPKSY